MVAQLRCWYHGTDGHAIVHCVTFQKIRDLKVKVVSFFFLFLRELMYLDVLTNQICGKFHLTSLLENKIWKFLCHPEKIYVIG